MQQAEPFVATLQKWLEIAMHRSIRSLICYARESGLSISQIGALFHIHRRGHSGVTDLGDHLGVTSAASSQMLERLAQQGLILRSEDPNDRRVKRIELTDKGLQTLRESFRAHQGWVHDLAAAMSEGEKGAAAAALGLMIDRANELGEATRPHNKPIHGRNVPKCDD